MDRARGGFVEALTQDGQGVDRPRRARVVGRQIYSFHVGGTFGWLHDADRLVRHGSDALYRHLIDDDGLTVSAYAADGRVLERGFDLYDHAFVLLALARLAESEPAALDTALRMIAAMERFRRPSGGWIATAHTGGDLLANPHMHMLESCLAFERRPDVDPIWARLSDEIVALAMERLIDPATGAMHEYRVADGGLGQTPALFTIEPGHQFEWAWLLRRWNARAGDAAVERAAARLVAIGEAYGVDDRGIVLDGLNSDLSPAARSARLWPQTERLKANAQAAALSSGEARRHAVERAIEAIEAIACFTAGAGRGLWFDCLDSAGHPVQAPAPASTLYHLVGAAEYCEGLAMGGYDVFDGG